MPRHAKDSARLSTGGNLQRLIVFQRLDRNLSAQRRLRERNRHGRVEIISLTLELFVLGDVDHDIQISSRATVCSRLAFALQPQPRTGFDAGRNFDFNRLLLLDTSGTATSLTGRTDNLAHATTGTAGARDRKESLLIANLARAFAGPTSFRLSAGGGAG